MTSASARGFNKRLACSSWRHFLAHTIPPTMADSWKDGILLKVRILTFHVQPFFTVGVLRSF